MTLDTSQVRARVCKIEGNYRRLQLMSYMYVRWKGKPVIRLITLIQLEKNKGINFVVFKNRVNGKYP